MKKLFLIVFSFLISTNVAFAKPQTCSVPQAKQETGYLESSIFSKADANKPEYKDLLTFISKYDILMNTHNESELRKLYTTDYVNADGIDLNSLFKLLDDTWKNFPAIKFATKVQSIRLNDNYATIEVFDTAKGLTGKTSELTNDIGDLDSNSLTLIYLKKSGNLWKITSDKILFEKTYLKYGKAKKYKVEFTAPEQVLAGTDYTASIYSDMPKNVVALASITKEPIVYPQTKAVEVFRQIPDDFGVLERVMKANTTNNNELAVASVGYTELVQDIYQKPQIKLTGMILVMQRVNVISKSNFVHTKENTNPI
jgi:hypothetical protein